MVGGEGEIVCAKFGSGLSVTAEMSVPFQVRGEGSGWGEKGICHLQFCVHP